MFIYVKHFVCDNSIFFHFYTAAVRLGIPTVKGIAYYSVRLRTPLRYYIAGCYSNTFGTTDKIIMCFSAIVGINITIRNYNRMSWTDYFILSIVQCIIKFNSCSKNRHSPKILYHKYHTYEKRN